MSKKVPKPGVAVRGSTSGRPIMALLDLLGRRWTLRLLWELRDGLPAKFRELRERCDSVSPTVLNERLAELREVGIVELADDGYCTTEHGATLLEALAPLHGWAAAWARRERGRAVARDNGSRSGSS
jgi:DNA-binding HxlR family transcriptional regulator